jgi:trimeric autotransporter adhesin
MRTSYFETERTSRRAGKVLPFGLAVLLTLFMLPLVLQAATKPAHAAATFTVDRSDDPDLTANPTADDCTAAADDCSLRGAITAANNTSGADTINFAIPGSGVKTIQVDGTADTTTSTDLPVITEQVIIDGYTQPGASPNTNAVLAQGTNANLLIELSGGTISGSNGLIQINASDVVVQGLVLKCFNSGIFISAGSGNVIRGNFIGNPSSVCSVNDGVVVSGSSSNNIIGGTIPAARNLISGNSSEGLTIAGNGGNTIQGNLIGTKANGTEGMGNAEGVEIVSPNNTVGNSTGDDEAGANLIAFNGTTGVSVFGVSGFSAGNRILSNSIHSNGTLGIDLTAPSVFSPDGVTANDRKDRDGGANNLQNFPRLTSANTIVSGTTTISGKLNSRPRRTFTIQLFSSETEDSSGYGEGKTYLGQKQIRTNREGKRSFTFSAVLPSGENIVTATATNNSTGDTSEFSRAVTAS